MARDCGDDANHVERHRHFHRREGTGATRRHFPLVVTQQANGNITVNEIDEATGNVDDTWTVSPTGQKM